MYPFVLDGERGRSSSPPRSIGIMVTDPTGRRHFFAGSTEELAMIFTKAACPEDVLKHPKTTIEFGEMEGRAWFVKQTVKSPDG